MLAQPELAAIRKFEAVGAQSWPAQHTYFDGTWCLRWTDRLASKRLNSINPLDPKDDHQIAQRLANARARFDEAGRPTVLRSTSLTSDKILDYLTAEKWRSFDETIVMYFPLPNGQSEIADQVSMINDPQDFAPMMVSSQAISQTQAGGYIQQISAIKHPTGLFCANSKDDVLCTAIGVTSYRMLGIFGLSTAPQHRRRGHAKILLGHMFHWAKSLSATTAWLQVEASNTAATALYSRLGFHELYRYRYWQKDHQYR